MARYIVYLKNTKAFKFYDNRKQVHKLANELLNHNCFSDVFVIDTHKESEHYPLATFVTIDSGKKSDEQEWFEDDCIQRAREIEGYFK